MSDDGIELRASDSTAGIIVICVCVVIIVTAMASCSVFDKYVQNEISKREATTGTQTKDHK